MPSRAAISLFEGASEQRSRRICASLGASFTYPFESVCNMDSRTVVGAMPSRAAISLFEGASEQRSRRICASLGASFTYPFESVCNMDSRLFGQCKDLGEIGRASCRRVGKEC